MNPTLQYRHLPFFIAALCATVVLPVVLWLRASLAVQVASNTFFAIYLVLMGLRIPTLTAKVLRSKAAAEDEPESIILIVTLGTVVVVVASLFVLINAAKAPPVPELVLSLASVALGWATIHTMMAMHYAHLYWRPGQTVEGGPSHDKKPRGGLDFPGGGEPQGYDFLYFSFVTGMTAQTSDVGLTATEMRKVNLVHGIVSFFFNTVLVAAAVNVAVAIGH